MAVIRLLITSSEYGKGLGLNPRKGYILYISPMSILGDLPRKSVYIIIDHIITVHLIEVCFDPLNTSSYDIGYMYFGRAWI